MTFSGCERINNSLGLSSAKSECPACLCNKQTIHEITCIRYPKTNRAEKIAVAILASTIVVFYVIGKVSNFRNRHPAVVEYAEKVITLCVFANAGYAFFKERKKEREDIMATSDNDKK